MHDQAGPVSESASAPLVREAVPEAAVSIDRRRRQRRTHMLIGVRRVIPSRAECQQAGLNPPFVVGIDLKIADAFSVRRSVQANSPLCITHLDMLIRQE